MQAARACMASASGSVTSIHEESAPSPEVLAGVAESLIAHFYRNTQEIAAYRNASEPSRRCKPGDAQSGSLYHVRFSIGVAMQAYLAAHDEFAAWLDAIDEIPSSAEVDERLWHLAVTAAQRGMSSTHWTFVVDGFVAYVNRARPGDILLSSYVARGFDLASRWQDVEREARTVAADRRASGR